MSYHGVGANGPTDYEPSYETQPAEPPRYGALQPYPWDAGVPRDWPPQGIVGPSGEYSTPGFRLPRAGMGAFGTGPVASPLGALVIPGLVGALVARYGFKQGWLVSGLVGAVGAYLYLRITR